MEEWRYVVGYEGRYKVSNDGRVASLLRGAASGRILSDTIIKGGYHRVQLYRNGSKRNLLTHLLVAAAFIGPCPSGHECNHKNGDKDDNSDQNLEYLTRTKNQQHARDVLGKTWPQGSRHHQSKLTESDVLRIRELRAQGLLQRQIATQFSVDQTTISLICRGRKWTHI